MKVTLRSGWYSGKPFGRYRKGYHPHFPEELRDRLPSSATIHEKAFEPEMQEKEPEGNEILRDLDLSRATAERAAEIEKNAAAAARKRTSKKG